MEPRRRQVKLVEEHDYANWGLKSHNVGSARPRGNVQVSRLLHGRQCYTTASVNKHLGHSMPAVEKPYFIPVGASANSLNGLGLARCTLEILNQEQKYGISYHPPPRSFGWDAS